MRPKIASITRFLRELFMQANWRGSRRPWALRIRLSGNPNSAPTAAVTKTELSLGGHALRLRGGALRVAGVAGQSGIRKGLRSGAVGNYWLFMTPPASIT